MQPKLNKKNRNKALKILKNLTGKKCYDKYSVNIYENWNQTQITQVVLQRHNITQETLDDFIDLDI